MGPILHMILPSPPVRAVLMTAKELGVKLKLKPCNLLANEQFSEGYLKMNPSHSVPTLDDDGFYLFESAAIMGYLVNKYGKNDSLYPKDIKKRATVDQLLHYSTQSFTTFLAMSRPIIISQKKKSTIMTEENKSKLFEKVEILNKLIGDKKYVAGDELTIADFSYVSWLSTLDVIYPIKKDDYPSTVRWWKGIEQLPSYEANVEGLAQFAKLWASLE